MTLILKNSPVGVDRAINTIQNALYTALVTNGTWNNYESYPRAYRNESESGIVPELFTGDGNDYVDVYMDDQFTVTSFFLVDDETEISDDMFTSDISVIFQVNLNKLYTTAVHRFDEEFRNQIVNVFKGLDGSFSFNSVTTSIDGVYAGLDTEKVRLTDTHPCHVVRFELSANYEHACDNVFASTEVTCNISVNVTTTDETSIGAEDGTATANVSGLVNGTLSYLWNDPVGQTTKTATGLGEGTYTVIVTDSLPSSPVCTATNSGTVESPPFSFGNALRFDGVNDNVTHSTIIGAGDYTRSFWINLDSAGSDNIIFGSGVNFVQVKLSTNQIRIQCLSNSTFDSPIAMTNGAWIHIVDTRITGVIRVYVNGIESTTGGIANTNACTSSGISTFAGFELEGILDDYAMLTGTGATLMNVTALYNGGNGKDFIDEMGSADMYFRMNESGTDSIAVDGSGNGINGTLNNFIFTPSPWVPHV
jgi:Concanavalin A-like lectin/glucanases superfamily